MGQRKHRRDLLWAELPGGGFHPFGLRARKGEAMHRIGDFAGLERLCREDLEKGGGDGATAGQCLLKLGVLAAQKGDVDSGSHMLNQARELFRKNSDGENEFFCRTVMVNVCIQQRRFAEAETAAAEMAKEAEARGDRKALANVLNLLGLTAMDQGQGERALEYFNRKLEITRALGLKAEQATALGNIGCVRIDQKRYSEAVPLILESLAIYRSIGDLYAEYYTLYNLAKSYDGLGRLEDALACYRNDLELARQLGDRPGEQELLEDIARVEKSMKGA